MAKEAVRQGAELYHTSKESGRKTSYYLRKDGKKVRISDHELPQIMHRNDSAYEESWHQNLSLTNDRVIMGIVRLTAVDGFRSFVGKLFREE